MRFQIACYTLAFALGVLLRSTAANELRAVVLSDDLPGLRAGAVVDIIGTPALNESGRVAIEAFFVDPRDTVPRGIWSERIGRLRPVVQDGDDVPGFGTFGPDDLYWDFNDAGHVVVSQSDGVLSDRTGALQTVATVGRIAPGSNRPFSLIARSWIDKNGAISFSGSYNQTHGFWTDRDGTLRRIITETDVLPGIMPFGYRGAEMSVTRDGQVVVGVAAEKSQPPSITTTSLTLVEGNRGWTALVRDGDVAPVPGGAETIAHLHTVASNDAVQLSFPAELVDTDGNVGNDFGVWKFDGNYRFLARSGNIVPSRTDSILLRGFTYTYISEVGNVAIQAEISDVDGGAPRSGILQWKNGELNKVAAVGDEAIGVGAGARFSNVSLLPFNGMDQVAMSGTLAGPGIDNSNDRGLWVQDRSGELQLIVRTGDMLEVAPGDRRTISSFLAGRSGRGDATSFNVRGQIAFSAKFTDGTSGVFVSDKVSIARALIAAGDEWRYLDDGSNQSTAWRMAGFNDAAWRTGRGELGYGDGDEATVIRCGPSASCNSNNHPTTYFRKTIDVEDPAAFAEMTLELLRDDGAAVYVNGVEVYRDASLAPNAAWNSLANFNGAVAVGGDDEDTFRFIPLSPQFFRSGTNVIAVEVHQAGANSSDVSFDMRLTGVLPTQVVPEPGSVFLAMAGLAIAGLSRLRKPPKPFPGKTCVADRRTLS